MASTERRQGMGLSLHAVPIEEETPAGSELRRLLESALRPIAHDYMPGWTGPFWTWFIVVTCLFRGVLLLRAPSELSSTLGAWVNVLGVHTYGSMFLGAGLLLACVKLWGRLGPVVIGLILASAVHVGYGTALLQGAATHAGNISGWSGGGAAYLAATLAGARVVSLMPAVRRLR